jgi:COP9 signalosome complex subunit 3
MQSSRLNKLDLDYGRSRDYLAKAVKYDGGSSGSMGRGGLEEDMFMNAGALAADAYASGHGAWGEESMFGS